MPTNLYGTHDNFDLNNFHVLPAMIVSFMKLKENGNVPVTLLGKWYPLREFLFCRWYGEFCSFCFGKCFARTSL